MRLGVTSEELKRIHDGCGLHHLEPLEVSNLESMAQGRKGSQQKRKREEDLLRSMQKWKEKSRQKPNTMKSWHRMEYIYGRREGSETCRKKAEHI